MDKFRISLSYVEQQGLIDALELYINSKKIHRIDDENYLSRLQAEKIIDLLTDDLSNAVTATIQSGRRYSFDKPEVT